MEMVKAITPAPAPAPENEAALENLKREMKERLAGIEQENTRLRSRVRDLESLIGTLQLWIWIGGGTLAILTIILLIAVLTRS